MAWMKCQPLEIFDEGKVIQLLCIATEPDGKQRLLTIDFDRRSFIALLESLGPDEEGRVEMPEVIWYDGTSVRLDEPAEVAEAASPGGLQREG